MRFPESEAIRPFSLWSIDYPMRFVVWYLVELFRLFFGFDVIQFSSLFFLQLRSLGQLIRPPFSDLGLICCLFHARIWLTCWLAFLFSWILFPPSVFRSPGEVLRWVELPPGISVSPFSAVEPPNKIWPLMYPVIFFLRLLICRGGEFGVECARGVNQSECGSLG
jgi:hypothetical protein